jgi:elongator complex protein 3
MTELTRPPREIVERILRAANTATDITRKSLGTIARPILAGTSFQFPTVMRYWEVYREMMADGSMEKNPALEKALRVKDVRTDSGVAPITVLTKPYPCPGKCVYCPTEARMPKSYISSEPAAARALSLRFDPFEQVLQRVQALEKNGHEGKKIELIIKGGTWSSYRWEYRQWFIKRCFDAANELSTTDDRFISPLAPLPAFDETILTNESTTDDELISAQNLNETADYRIIGLTIETRPDWVNAKEIIRLRQLGCTRVELGVQTLQDAVLDLTNRGHHIDATIRATALLKQAGFKVDFHILPGQPGSTPEKDLEDFRTLFSDAKYRPDMIKLYPCVVLPTAELHAWAQEGRFTPMEGTELRELLMQMQTIVPRYCRISRLIRDFPEKDISYGNKITNLRMMLEDEMKERGLICKCLRCREVGHVKDIDPNSPTQLFEEWYDSASGREVFLTIEDAERKAVFAFLRLRLPHLSSRANAMDLPIEYTNDSRYLRESLEISEAFPVLTNTAIVRELHTYGTALNLNQNSVDASQHRGYGRKLMQAAEEIATRESYLRIAVISGIGVREYYRWLGYAEKETYMVKELGK